MPSNCFSLQRPPLHDGLATLELLQSFFSGVVVVIQPLKNRLFTVYTTDGTLTKLLLLCRSLRPRSRSSCHSSPSTVPNSRLTTPLSTHVTGTPTLALIEENPQPRQAYPPSPGGSRKKTGRSRFGRSPDSASLQRSPERAPRAVPVAIDENQPTVPGRKELSSPPRGPASAEPFACQNGVRLQKEVSKEAALFGSPPKQPFLELRDFNSKPLPGFISQVAITASAKQHLAAGAAVFGNGTQRKFTFGPEGKGEDFVGPVCFARDCMGKEEGESAKVPAGARRCQCGGGGSH